MVWKVDVSFGRSAVHGRGAFACSPIRAGTRVWEWDRTTPVFDQRSLGGLEPKTLSLALLGGYLHRPSQLFLWCIDGMQFMNHGPPELANVGLNYWPRLEDDHSVALRDVQPGEELLEDYGMCLSGGLNREHWLYPLYIAFSPQHLAFLLQFRRTSSVESPSPAVRHDPGRNLRRISESAPSSTGLDNTASKPEARHAA